MTLFDEVGAPKLVPEQTEAYYQSYSQRDLLCSLPIGALHGVSFEPRTESTASCCECTVSSVRSDSFDDYSIISALSADSVPVVESFDCSFMQIDPVNQDSHETSFSGRSEYHIEKPSAGAATVVSSNCSTSIQQEQRHPADCSMSSMSTASSTSSLIDLISRSLIYDVPWDESFSHTETLHLVSTSAVDYFPLLVLPDELICCITSYLDVETLIRTRIVCTRLKDVGARDEAGWVNHCQTLWPGKAHVCSDARSLLSSHNAMDAYHVSCRDGGCRHEITEEELCFDPSSREGFIWGFRFKGTAGADWTSWDPWWSGGHARQIVFLNDGTVKQFVPLNRDSPTESSKMKDFVLLPPFYDVAASTLDDDLSDRAPGGGLHMTWRFTRQPMDLPARPKGAYIRISIAGRDVPTYIIRRSQTGNWGFIMENCWGVYYSFPLPSRPVVDDHMVRHRRMRLRRINDGGRWLDVTGIESESEEEDFDDDYPRERNTNRSGMIDSSLLVTPTWQWREALLYNYGAVSLPEGEGATAEFDRVWNQGLRPWQLYQDALPGIDQDMLNFVRHSQVTHT